MLRDSVVCKLLQWSVFVCLFYVIVIVKDDGFALFLARMFVVSRWVIMLVF